MRTAEIRLMCGLSGLSCGMEDAVPLIALAYEPTNCGTASAAGTWHAPGSSTMIRDRPDATRPTSSSSSRRQPRTLLPPPTWCGPTATRGPIAA